jgi:hypothetical protein
MKPSLFAAATLAALLSACATAPQQTTPVVTPSVPSMPPTPITTPTGPVVSQPVSPPAPVPPFPAYPNEAAARALVQNKLLPASVRDKAGWSQEIVGAFTGLHLPYRADLLCAAMAVIEQESTWQADPVVPGLGEMVWKKIAEKAGGVIPVAALKVAFLKPSATGESYTSRIDRLRTEKEMNALFEDMEYLNRRKHYCYR